MFGYNNRKRIEELQSEVASTREELKMQWDVLQKAFDLERSAELRYSMWTGDEAHKCLIPTLKKGALPQKTAKKKTATKKKTTKK